MIGRKPTSSSAVVVPPDLNVNEKSNTEIQKIEAEAKKAAEAKKEAEVKKATEPKDLQNKRTEYHASQRDIQIARRRKQAAERRGVIKKAEKIHNIMVQKKTSTKNK